MRGQNRSIVGIGAVCVASGDTEFIAYAIGSCIALCLYDARSGIGAMAHILLPAAGERRGNGPGLDISTKYADHALTAALNKMLSLGADIRRIEAGIIGGAEMFPHGNMKALNIGQMNVASVTEELNKSGIPLKFSQTGGKISRTVTFTLSGEGIDKQIFIRSPQIKFA